MASDKTLKKLYAQLEQDTKSLDDAWARKTIRLIDKARIECGDLFVEEFLPYAASYPKHMGALVKLMTRKALSLRGKAKTVAFVLIMELGAGVWEEVASYYFGEIPTEIKYDDPKSKAFKAARTAYLAQCAMLDVANHRDKSGLGTLVLELFMYGTSKSVTAAHHIAEQLDVVSPTTLDPLHAFLRSSRSDKIVGTFLENLSPHLPTDPEERVAWIGPGMDHWSESIQEKVEQLCVAVGGTPPQSRWAECPCSPKLIRALLASKLKIRDTPRANTYSKDAYKTRGGAWLEHFLDTRGGKIDGHKVTYDLFDVDVQDWTSYEPHADGTPAMYATFALIGPSFATYLGFDVMDPSSDPAVAYLGEGAEFSYVEFNRFSEFLASLY